MLFLDYFGHFTMRRIFFVQKSGDNVESSVPSKAVWPKIGQALWKIGTTGFVRMSTKYAFSLQFSLFSA